MPDLRFEVTGAAPVEFAAAPTIGLKLLVRNDNPAEEIQSIALRTQIQLDVARRNYSAAEKENLRDLFGEPSRWGQTLRPMLWTHVHTVAPSFTGSATIELQTPCTFDFNVAATKYFYGLESGEIPLCLLFSGTVFQAGDDGVLNVSPIPWDRESRFRLPASVWREMMNAYYPNTAWLCLRRDVFDRVYQFKVRQGIPTWEQALDRLLDQAGKAVPK